MRTMTQPPTITPHEVICPDCETVMILRATDKFKRRPNDPPRLFYGCRNWPECCSAVGAHPDGSPMGFPADAETRRLRHTCHEVFDSWWKRGRMTRKQAYKRLQAMMDLDEASAHFGMFDKAQCEEFLRKARAR